MDETVPPPRVRLLGGDVDLVTPHAVLRRIETTAAVRGKAVIANHNAHSLHLSRRSDALRRFFARADLVQIDSTPLILWGRALGLPLSADMRSTYLDWRDDFWSLAARRRWRVFYLGGAPGVARLAAGRLSARYPGVRIDVRDGYFDPARGGAENAEVLAQIGGFDPDVLMVGMGMPRQELWVLDNLGALNRGAILTVGAAFDYEAGVQPTPPRWAGRLGVEWLVRLVGQPRRLAHRYLVEPWSLIRPALDDLAAALDRRSSDELLRAARQRGMRAAASAAPPCAPYLPPEDRFDAGVVRGLPPSGGARSAEARTLVRGGRERAPADLLLD